MSKRKSLLSIGDEIDNLESSKTAEDTTLPQTTVSNHPTTSLGMFGGNKSSDTAKREFVFLVDPNSCAPWAFHNRKAASWWNYESCKDVIESIRNRGQDTPVWARKVNTAGDSKISWEIIAGRRRWFACKYLEEQLKIKEFEGTDREAAVLMNSENMDRDDITEFEYALSFKEQIEQNLFSSQDDMLLALTSSEEGHLKLNKSKLSKMLKAAELYKHPTLEKLFPDAASLKVNPVYELMLEVKTNKSVIMKKADALVQKYSNKENKAWPKPSEIIKELLSVLDKKDDNAPKVYETQDDRKLKLFEVTTKKDGLALIIDKESLNPSVKEELMEAFTRMLGDFS